jgi:nucleoside-diphosphate-sugar epimerase
VAKKYLVTGGSGFIGSALVKRLIQDGDTVRVLDDLSRGRPRRLRDVEGRVEFMQGDVRNAADVESAVRGMDSILHLAFVNGTEFFYTKPDLVLEVGVKGMVNVVDAARKHGTPELVLASSSEVYQSPAKVPTDETVPLLIPDPLNPRYSYGAGKIISEMMALHQAGRFMKRVMIFRPHNVYGPDMGGEHVLPQFVLRMKALADAAPGEIAFPIQGTGEETRSFIDIRDFTDGLAVLLNRGEHLGIYHIGTREEVRIADVARLVGAFFDRSVRLVPKSGSAPGGTLRRCPDIRKMTSLGFDPQITLARGLPDLARWYVTHAKETA